MMNAKEFKAVDSNTLIKALFSEAPLDTHYQKTQLQQISTPVSKSIHIKKKSGVGYYIPLSKRLLIGGETKAFFW